ncbi:MAG: MFS transporter [Ilumatobacteraceae bacterium]
MDPGVSTSRPQWLAFGLVCLAYLGVTVGEQVLSPVLPDVSADLGISEGQSGLAFGMLALAIAVANLVGGAVLGRTGGRMLMLAGLAATVIGAVCGATANGFATMVVAQVLLGTGAGLYFPAGLQAVPFIAGSSRKGFAMGIYGVAFSGGLTACCPARRARCCAGMASRASGRRLGSALQPSSPRSASASRRRPARRSRSGFPVARSRGFPPSSVPSVPSASTERSRSSPRSPSPSGNSEPGRRRSCSLRGG